MKKWLLLALLVSCACTLLPSPQAALAEEATAVYHFITIVECLTGAGAFMLCMGIGTRYSRKQAPMDYLRRGFELLTVGQALNLARDAVPNLIALWPLSGMIFKMTKDYFAKVK